MFIFGELDNIGDYDVTTRNFDENRPQIADTFIRHTGVPKLIATSQFLF